MRRHITAQPSFVLLHGAGLGSWVWERVCTQLKHRAVALDLPGRAGIQADFSRLSLDDLAAYVVDEIESRALHPVVLVAHAEAGPLALRISSLLPERVASCVLIGAAVSEPGRSYASTLPWMSRVTMQLLAKVRPAGLRAADATHRALCGGLDANDAAFVQEHLVPEAPALLFDAAHWDAPTRAVYVHLAQDETELGPEVQARMAARLPLWAKHRYLNTGHLPMLEDAATVAHLLDDEAALVGAMALHRYTPPPLQPRTLHPRDTPGAEEPVAEAIPARQLVTV